MGHVAVEGCENLEATLLAGGEVDALGIECEWVRLEARALDWRPFRAWMASGPEPSSAQSASSPSQTIQAAWMTIACE